MFHCTFNLRGLWFYFAIQEEYVSIIDVLEDREKHRKEKKKTSLPLSAIQGSLEPNRNLVALL